VSAFWALIVVRPSGDSTSAQNIIAISVRFIDIAKYALQNSYHQPLDGIFFRSFVMLFRSFFHADDANVQFADISDVLETTVAEIQGQTSRSAMPDLFIHLVHMPCRLMSTEAEISFR